MTTSRTRVACVGRRNFGYGRPIVVFTIMLLGGACSTPSPPPLKAPAHEEWFEDATERLGLQFTHDPGASADYFMPRSMGSGCAIFDADGDGKPDLLLLQNAGPNSPSTNKLFRQTADGTFVDVTAKSGLDFAGHNMGVAIGDVDGDGRPDVLITQYRSAKLLLNRSNCQFDDVTASAGIENTAWGTSASFLDYDRDGRLDIVIANYVVLDSTRSCESPTDGQKEFCGPNNFPGSAGRLFHNLGAGNGSRVRFEDVSVASGLGKEPGPGLGVYCADLTGDGWPDIVVANDEKPNRLWVNQRNGTFRDEGVSRGLALTASGQVAANMGIAVGDIDGDGFVDVFVTHLTNEMNTLWQQNPAGVFRDRTLQVSAVATRWRGTGFGTTMADFDRDGKIDLALVNGRIARGPQSASHLPMFWQRYGERNQLLRNTGGKFEDVSEANAVFCGRENIARGLAVGDVDGDGRPDLVVNAIAGPAKLYLNRTDAKRHWLAVRPKTADGRLAYGAEVRVTANGQTQIRIVQPGESYLSSSLPEALFGLGDTREYQEIQVRWPNGKVQQFPKGQADQRIDLVQSNP